MYHAMANGANGRAINQGFQCLQDHPKRALMVLGCLGFGKAAFGQFCAQCVTQREARRGANAFHLAIMALRQALAR